MHIPILILGGGITGLSTAYHLEQAGCTDYLLAEKESVFGGLCASVQKDGFTLDYGGHLLHLHTPQGERLIRTLLGDNLVRRKRDARIFFEGKQIPFPFQASLWALPEPVRRKCAQGLMQITQNPPDKNAVFAHFEAWCLAHFGQGIYDAFMRPYNEKLWGCALTALSCAWCKTFVPTPTLAQIQASLTRPPEQDFGYNAYFYYPKQGGSGALTDALARKITRKRACCTATHLDLTRREVHFGSEIISYDTLVSTLPLPALVRLITHAPEPIKTAAAQLVAQPVQVLHLAIARKTEPFSWIYFADKQIPFYRVGLQSGFSPANAPEGTSLFYIEFSGTQKPDTASVRRALHETGLVRPDDTILLSHWQTLPYAYVRYDRARDENVAQITAFLAENNCFCAGRYGKWEYSFMEDNLMQGARLAQKLV